MSSLKVRKKKYSQNPKEGQVLYLYGHPLVDSLEGEVGSSVLVDQPLEVLDLSSFLLVGTDRNQVF